MNQQLNQKTSCQVHGEEEEEDTTSPMACSCSRRDFLGLTAASMAAVGAAAAAWPLIDSLNPAADTLAQSTTEVDVSNLAYGHSMTALWRGKPVFIRRRTAQEIEAARSVKLSDLKDPQTDEDRVIQAKTPDGNLHPEWLVVLGVCTHLGCVPLGQKDADSKGDFGGWFCPCHGSHYDISGRIRKGPAPANLEVPPWRFISDGKIVIGKA